MKLCLCRRKCRRKIRILHRGDNLLLQHLSIINLSIIGTAAALTEDNLRFNVRHALRLLSIPDLIQNVGTLIADIFTAHLCGSDLRLEQLCLIKIVKACDLDILRNTISELLRLDHCRHRYVVIGADDRIRKLPSVFRQKPDRLCSGVLTKISIADCCRLFRNSKLSERIQKGGNTLLIFVVPLRSSRKME